MCLCSQQQSLTLTCFLFTGRRRKHRRPSHHAFQQAEGKKRAAVISPLLFSKGCSSHIHPSIHPPSSPAFTPPSSLHSLREEGGRKGMRLILRGRTRGEEEGWSEEGGRWKEERRAYDSSWERREEGRRRHSREVGEKNKRREEEEWRELPHLDQFNTVFL